MSQFLAAQVRQKIADTNKGSRAKRAGNVPSPSPSVPLLNLLMEMGFNRRTVDAALKVVGKIVFVELHLHLLLSNITVKIIIIHQYTPTICNQSIS